MFIYKCLKVKKNREVDKKFPWNFLKGFIHKTLYNKFFALFYDVQGIQRVPP